MPGWNILFLSECDSSLTADTHDTREKWWEPHIFYRHYPGEGAKPMAFVVHKRIAHIVRKVVWQRRAGGLHMYQNSVFMTGAIKLSVAGVHCAHGADLQDSLADATSVFRILWEEFKTNLHGGLEC